MASRTTQVFEAILIAYDGLCYTHGAKLKKGAPTANWGLLGHAAEFLAAQRGLRT